MKSQLFDSKPMLGAATGSVFFKIKYFPNFLIEISPAKMISDYQDHPHSRRTTLNMCIVDLESFVNTPKQLVLWPR